jgi:hypothetical protein
VRAASQQIQIGKRVGLNWDLTKLEFPGYGRISCDHKVVPLLDGEAFDDVYMMNPRECNRGVPHCANSDQPIEQSSQWDGLRHWSRPSTLDPQQRVWYGGTTKGEILDRSNDRIGIHHWSREGITGRGVLIDYASWAEKKGIQYSAFSLHVITLSDILQIAHESHIVFETGDILIVRSGMTREWEQKMDSATKKAYSISAVPQHAGLEASTDMLRWIWDTGFAAVAGDAISFEVYPPLGEICLHDYLLAGWGMPIGKTA